MTYSYQQRLAYNFSKQEQFASDYSPLYTCFFGTVANWLEVEPATPLIQWLLQASEGRQPFDITLLLAAGLHRDILLKQPKVASLAAFYPSVGGGRPCQDADYADALAAAIWAQRDRLEPFIQSATVQTNETGRGLCWYLPLRFLPWQAVHLLDLGASAGLNLAADRRAFRLLGDEEMLDLGAGQPLQFVSQTEGNGRFLAQRQPLPQILSRTGGDIAPFPLETAVDEQTLAAFVWADQRHRLDRLREGIVAYRELSQTKTPINVLPLDLPNGLGVFLEAQFSNLDAPLVLYNTFVTAYLPERGRELREQLTAWASQQKRPILWLQWEPPHGNLDAAPKFGWCVWTADCWYHGNHHQWLLGWVQPHGTQLQWQQDFAAWGAQLPLCTQSDSKIDGEP